MVIAGFLGGALNWLAFFGIDARTIRDQVSAHYVFLLGAVAFTALFGYGVYLWWKSSQVTTENIERKVRQWTDAFGFPSRVLNDDKLHFGLQVELPSRVHVAIRRQKDRPSYLTLINRIVMSDKQRAVFDKMSEEEQGVVHRTMRLECGRSKIEYHSNKKLEFVCIHKQLPITPDLTEAHLINSISEVNFAAIVVMETVNGLIKPPA